jgi:hypothetical protein
MAFEVKVYREVTRYQARVLFGLSWRQLAVVAVAFPVVAGVYGACFLAGQENLGVILVTLAAIPAVCVGWVRPAGVPFEKYARYWFAHRFGPRHFTYSSSICGEATHEETSTSSLTRRSRRARRRIAAGEAAE